MWNVCSSANHEQMMFNMLHQSSGQSSNLKPSCTEHGARGSMRWSSESFLWSTVKMFCHREPEVYGGWGVQLGLVHTENWECFTPGSGLWATVGSDTAPRWTWSFRWVQCRCQTSSFFFRTYKFHQNNIQSYTCNNLTPPNTTHTSGPDRPSIRSDLFTQTNISLLRFSSDPFNQSG